jgi:hypothetical protein
MTETPAAILYQEAWNSWAENGRAETQESRFLKLYHGSTIHTPACLSISIKDMNDVLNGAAAVFTD